MEVIYRAGSDAEAGYLCDLLGQHDIAAQSDALTIRVAGSDRDRAQAIIHDAVSDPDDDSVPWYRRWLGVGRRTVTTIVLLILVFAVTTLALGRADPVSVGVLLALVLLVLVVGWRSKGR